MAQKFRKAKITTTLVESLKQGETVGDTHLPGYFVRRQRAKACVYFIRRFSGGQRHYVTIGEHGAAGMTEKKARDRALIIWAGLSQGSDPTTERAKARGMPTLGEFTEDFFSGHGATLKPRTLENYRSLLRCHVAPSGLCRVKLDKVTRQQVAGLHRKLKEKRRTANHVVAFLSSLFSEARAAGLVPEDFDPTKRIKLFKTEPRQRFLMKEELGRVADVMRQAERDGEENPFAMAAIRLLIFTGARRDEILTLRWDWVDIERGILNLPDSKTGSKPIYLSPPALTVLNALPRIKNNPFVVVGLKEGQHLVNLRKPWVRIRDKAGLEPVVLPDGSKQHVRIHDLRHTFASLAVNGGASLPMIGKLMGHTQVSTTARYAHLAENPLRRVNDAAGQWAADAMGVGGDQDAVAKEDAGTEF